MFREFRARAFLALTLLAWLVGSTWHGAMQVGSALGQEVCTSKGAIFVAGSVPVQPGKPVPVGKSCPLCVAFGAPASVSADIPVVAPMAPYVVSASTLDFGAVLPAAHLADLATRAPPRA